VGFVMNRLIMKRTILAALVALLAGDVHGIVAREDGRKRPDDSPTAAQIAACAPDARRFCLRHFGDREAMKACMIEHKKQLSETCRAAFR
jgi:hypothetical protein